MRICPIALAITCRRCPIVKVCPVKTVIGDHVEPPPVPPGTSDRPVKARPKATGRGAGR